MGDEQQEIIAAVSDQAGSIMWLEPDKRSASDLQGVCSNLGCREFFASSIDAATAVLQTRKGMDGCSH